MKILDKLKAAINPPQNSWTRAAAVTGALSKTVYPKGSVFLSVLNTPDADEITIDGPIGDSWWDNSGTTSRAFNEALSRIPKGRNINVKINTEGGSVGDALAMHNALKERGDCVTCTVTGYALSSGSIVALGGARCHMPKASIMMIHEPWTMTMGDKEDHDKASKMLETHGDTIAGIYADKTGKSMEECRALMKDETWMSGEDAEEEGFADPHDPDEDEETEARSRVETLNCKGVVSPKISAVPVNGGGTGPTASNTNTQTMTNAPAVAAPAAPPPVAAPAAPQTVTIDASQWAEVNAKLDRERKARIESRIDGFIGDCRLTNEERPKALARCLNDESYLDELAARPVIVDSGRSPGQGYDLETGGTVTGNGTVWDRIRDLKGEGQPAKVGGMAVNAAYSRNQFRTANWDGLMSQAMMTDQRGTKGARLVSPATCGGMKNLPVNANTYASALVVDFLADAAITQLVATLAPLRVFVRDFMPSPFAPLNTLQVRLVTTSSAAQTMLKEGAGSAISNYESGDNTVNNVAISMSEYSQAFHVNAQELMSGLRIEYLAQHNLMTLGNQLQQVCLNLFRSGNSTTAYNSGVTVDAHTGNFQWNSASSAVADMATLRGKLGKSPIKNAILDPAYFSKLITIPVGTPAIQLGVPHQANVIEGVFGWNEIAETTAWAATMGVAGSDTTPIAGFVCNPQCAAVGARLPITPPQGIPGNTLVEAQVAIPGIDLTLAIFHWFSLSSRTLWNSFGIVFGAAQGDLTAATVLRYAGA